MQNRFPLRSLDDKRNRREKHWNIQWPIIVVAVLMFSIGGFIVGICAWMKTPIPFVGKKNTEWAIGIYKGKSPWNLSPEKIRNPVLTAEDVSDVQARFVADPFMVYENSTWYMFFEVLNMDNNQGDIAFATSNDGLSWTYQRIILDESFHLSYPYVFKWQNEYFMIPETRETSSIRLYKAILFPTRWVHTRTLLKGRPFGDPSLCRYQDKWYLFTETSPELRCDTLRLYYSDKLMGPWVEHPRSPIVEGDANIARPAGRVLKFDGKLYRFAQDDDPTYGNQVRAFRITELTTRTYDERGVNDNPILRGSGTGWNAKRMHHIDPQWIAKNRWIACVDGY